MNPTEFDIDEATQCYRILGLNFTATKDEIRHNRNRLLTRFHPDKYPQGWVVDETNPEQRVYLIQHAFLYIMSHYGEIQKAFNFLNESALSNHLPLRQRSHWIYSTIATINHQ